MKNKVCATSAYVHIRKLGFKFVDFLHISSDICNIDIKIISSENTTLYLSYEIFYSVWMQNNIELNTITLHHPGHAVETVTLKLRLISINTGIKTCFEPNNMEVPLFTSKIVFGYLLINTAKILRSS